MRRYYCRTHGEPLVLDFLRLLYRCPERSCRTYVAEEHAYPSDRPDRRWRLVHSLLDSAARNY